MISRRVFYLTLILILSVLYLLTGAYYLFVIIVLMGSMALISLVCMLIGSFEVGLDILEENGLIKLYYTSHITFPLGQIRGKCTIHNHFFDETIQTKPYFLVGDKSILLPIHNKDLKFGHYKLNDCSFVLMDMLCLFSKKINKVNVQSIAIQPMILKVDEQANIFHSVQENQLLKADDYDIREYRIGDSLKSIHYKISYKLSKYMIKEKRNEASDTISVLLDLSGDEQDCLQVFSLLYEFIHCLQFYNEKCTVYWYSKEGLYQDILSSSNEVESLIDQIITLPKTNQIYDLDVTWVLTPSGLEGGE